MSEDKEQQNLNKLNRLAARSGRLVYKLSAVFPFDLFPSQILIDETKITIKDKIFFFSEQVFPITYENLNSAVIDIGLFFATMRFEISGYNDNPAPIKYLWNGQARRARRIILGLLTCHKEGVDLTQFDLETVKKKAEEIGSTKA